VELHAHLNGCIREKTILELAQERNVSLNEHHFSSQNNQHDEHSMYNLRPRSLQDCFEIFAEIPKCVDDLAALRRITQEALEDFSQQNVAYLELRSTPKILLEERGCSAPTTKQRYCETILECMEEFEEREQRRFDLEMGDGTSGERHGITSDSHDLQIYCCHRPFAIHRRSKMLLKMWNWHTPFERTVTLPIEWSVWIWEEIQPETRNHFNDFRPAFEKARDYGLKVTLHCIALWYVGWMLCFSIKSTQGYWRFLLMNSGNSMRRRRSVNCRSLWGDSKWQ